MRTLKHAALAAALVASFTPALAASSTAADDGGQIQLSAQAREEVANDTLTALLYAEEQDADSAALANRINQKLEQAYARARKAGFADIRAGNYTTTPVINQNGKISGWRARGEVVIESTRIREALAVVSSLQQELMLQQLGFSLSRKARDALEQKLTDEAIAAFRDKAQRAARAFGYAGYEIREVSVDSASDGDGRRPMLMMAKAGGAARADAVAELSAEAGKATLSVNVAGSVRARR